jgi:hypothetical protein
MPRLSKMFGIDPTVGSVCNRVWDTIDGIQSQASEIPATAYHQSLTKVWDTTIVSHQVFWIGSQSKDHSRGLRTLGLRFGCDPGSAAKVHSNEPLPTCG